MIFLKFKRFFLLSAVACCAAVSLTVAASNVPVPPVHKQMADEVALRCSLDQLFETILEWKAQGKPFDNGAIGALLESAFEHWNRIQTKFINAGWYQNLMPQACGAISEKFDELFKLLLQEKNSQHYVEQVVKLRSMIEQLMLNVQDRVSGFSELSKPSSNVQKPIFTTTFSQEVLKQSKTTEAKMADFLLKLTKNFDQNELDFKTLMTKGVTSFCEKIECPEYRKILLKSILKSELDLFSGQVVHFLCMITDALHLRDFYREKEFEILLTKIFEENKKWFKSWALKISDILTRDIFFLVRESDGVVMQPTDQEARDYDIEKAAESINKLEEQFKKYGHSFSVPKGYVHIVNEASILIKVCRENLGKLTPTWAGSVGTFFGLSKKLSTEEELVIRKKLVINLYKLLAYAEYAKYLPVFDTHYFETQLNVQVNDFISKIPHPRDICKTYADTCGSPALYVVKKERLALYKDRINQIEYIVEIQDKMLENLPEDQNAEHVLMRKAVSKASTHLYECKRLVEQYNSFVCSTGKIDDLQKMFDICEAQLDRSFVLLKQASCEFGRPIFTANLCAPRKSYKDVEPEMVLNQQKFGVVGKKSAFSLWILDPCIVNPFITHVKNMAAGKIDEVIQQTLGVGGFDDTAQEIIKKLKAIPDATLRSIGRGLRWRESSVTSFAASLLNYKVSRWFVRAVLPDTISYLEYLDNAGLDVQQVVGLLNQFSALTLGKISTNDLISQMIEQPACFKLYLKHIVLKWQNKFDGLKPNSVSSLSQTKKDKLYRKATETYFPDVEPRIVMDKKGVVDKWLLAKTLSTGMGVPQVSKKTFEMWKSFAKESEHLLPLTSLQGVRNNCFATSLKSYLTSHLMGLIKMVPVQDDQDAWAKRITNADVAALNNARKSISLELNNLKNQKKTLDGSYSWYHYLWFPSLISYWKQDSLLQLNKQSLSLQKKLCVHAIALSNVNKMFAAYEKVGLKGEQQKDVNRMPQVGNKTKKKLYLQ